MSAPVLIVAGLGRCGTTLAMTMLHAGGVPCVGGPPDFEDMRTLDAIDDVTFAAWAGHAVKILHPYPIRWPASPPTLAIWLDRDPVQQARSQAKLAVLGMGLPRPTRGHMKRWVASLAPSARQARKALSDTPTLTLRFEDLIRSPGLTALRIADFLAPAFGPLNYGAMAAQVRPRSPDCAPDLAIEEALIAMAPA